MKFNGFCATPPAKFLAVMAIFLIALISLISLFPAKVLSAGGDCCDTDEECGYNPANCDQPGEPCCDICQPPGTGCIENSGTCQTTKCEIPLTCSFGICRYTNGHTCTSGSDCVSGFCVDGYCCNANCTACQRCDVSGSTGTCTGINADSGRNCTSGCTRCVSTNNGKCIARSDTAECGTCQNCPAGACLGTSAACNRFYGQNTCQDQEGCSWIFNVQTCSCREFDDDRSGCLSEGECMWESDTQRCLGDYDCSYYSCLGTPTACSAYIEPISCENQTGCQFPAGTCGGTPTACSSLFGQIACQRQGGCSWNWQSDTCLCSELIGPFECNSQSGCTWNEYMSRCEGQYDCGYNICQGTPTACSAYYINQSVCLGQAGCQWFLNDCQALTANNGKNCNEECTRCAGGSCVNRNQCNTTECSAGFYCDSTGGSCVDPDTSSQPGENVCEACVASGQNSFGEGWPFESPTTQYCCGDDSSEYSRTRVCSSGCTSNPSDTMCCNNQNDCVYTSTCYTPGSNYCSPWSATVIASCSSGSWAFIIDCAANATFESDGGCADYITGGYIVDYTACNPVALNCGSTTLRDTCGAGNVLTEYCANLTSYRNTTFDCDNSDFCNRSSLPYIYKDYYCADTTNDYCDHTSNDPDSSQTYCVGCGVSWNIGGEINATACCGDDSGEYNRTETGATDAPSIYKDGITACCDASTDCNFNDACFASGLTASMAIPLNAYCNAGTWQGGDDSQTACNAIAGGGRWNMGGIANCCGDDSSEYNRTRTCDGYACATNISDNACCDNANDCVWQDACYNNGATRPGLPGATCVSGTWRDSTAPDTVISPNGGDFTGSNETTFNLSCSDTGGGGCKEIRYRIVDDGQQGTLCAGYGDLDRITTSSFITNNITCPFGQICNRRVCFASEDNASNRDAMNISNVFHLETNACMGRVCGQACLFTPGICNATNGNCYTTGGCRLNCSSPATGPGQERVWNRANCGRSNATKCGDQHVCANSITDLYCSTGGASTAVTGDWSSYTPPNGYYGTGYTFHINILNVSASPSQFSILAECQVVKANGNMIYFDSWGNGDNDFSYTVTASDPEGVWNVTYCGLWSDFLQNGGWQQKYNNTLYQFYVDRTPPSITINNPVNNGAYGLDITVNATVSDAVAGVGTVRFRWENTTSSGNWVQMTRTGSEYTGLLAVAPLADGRYNVTVWANDSVGNYNQVRVLNILIDRLPPSISILSPTSNWYRANFDVRALVTDNQGVGTVRYRWENATSSGLWNSMTFDVASGNYLAPFAVTSVSPGNYTIRVWADDTFGNSDNKTVNNFGIDYINPVSSVINPSPNTMVMSSIFDINWTGIDAHSGVRCYNISYTYCPNGVCVENEYIIDACTSQLGYVFDVSEELVSVTDPNNYTFMFRSVARDAAGNLESKSSWDTNVTIYIPRLIRFTTTELVTMASIRNGGKIPAFAIPGVDGVRRSRSVIINVSALPSITQNINITIYYSNHTMGTLPSQWASVTCANTRQCIANITVNVTEAESITEVDYYIMAQNTTMTEFLPPNAPGSYFYYLVYYHPVSNFLIMNDFRTILGSNDLMAIEIRNIRDQFDNVTLQLAPAFGRFAETDETIMYALLNPSEERVIYAMLVPSSEGFTLRLAGLSQIDADVLDEDSVDVKVDMPPNFSELSDAAAIALVLLAGMIYFKCVRKEERA